MVNQATTKQPPEWADEKYITSQFGLTHTPLFNLRKAGKIRSISTRGDGQSYGKRLFHVGSIREFLEQQEAREREAQTEDADDKLVEAIRAEQFEGEGSRP